MFRTAVVALLAAALLPGCSASKETRTAADRLDDQLGSPSWTTAVDVGSGRDGQGNEYVATVVELAASATPDEVADFVVAMPDQTHEAGLTAGFNNRQLTFVSADGARLNIGWQPQVARDEVLRGVAEWFGVGQAYGGGVAATALTGGGASYKVDLGPGQPTSVAAAYATLAPLAQPDSHWEVVGEVGDETLDLSGSTLPSSGQLGIWTTMLDRLGALPAPLKPGRLNVNFEGDRTVADESFLVPDTVTADQLTLAAYGDRLWPVFRPQLRTLADLRKPWSFFVEWAPASRATSESFLISLLSDQAVSDNGDETTRWSEAAQVYVHGLPS